MKWRKKKRFMELWYCVVFCSRCVLVYAEFFGYGTEFVVPFFAKTSDEWFAQELVEAYATFCAEFDGILADVPSVVVQPCEQTEFFLSYGIEVATDGFLSEQTSFCSSKSAVAATDNACHEFAFWVVIGNSLFVDDCLRASRQLRPEVVELHLYVCNLVKCDRCSGVSFFAAASVTTVDVAAEVFSKDVGVQYDVAYLDEVTI